MPSQVEILEQEEIFRAFIFRIDLIKLRFERFDGTMSAAIERVSLERGDGVAGVLHNLEDDTVILVEQFRASTYSKDAGWLVELPAGIVETGEDPAGTMMREIEEEAGYQVNTVHPISTFFLSPGGSSERIFLFYARVNAAARSGEGGGLASENEDIRVIHLPVDEAIAQMQAGAIRDAKTLIGLQWLQLNRENLPD